MRLLPLLMLCAMSSAQPIPLEAYLPLWSREKELGSAVVDEGVRHGGKASLRIEHRGEKDWSLATPTRVAVKEGEIYELSAAVKVSTESTGQVTVGATSHDGKGQAVNWSLGARHAKRGGDFQVLRTRFVIPAGTSRIAPRLMGHGPVTAWVMPLKIKKLGSVETFRKVGVKEGFEMKGYGRIAARFDTASATFTVSDRESGRTFKQVALSADLVVTGFAGMVVPMATAAYEVSLYHIPNDLHLKAACWIGRNEELCVQIEAAGDAEFTQDLAWPFPFVMGPDAARRPYLVLPINEGLSYGVDDGSIAPTRYICYGGHGLCMPFFGVVDQLGKEAMRAGGGYGAIVETPDDASVQMSRCKTESGEALCAAPVWQGQKGRFGYDRTIRYFFLGEGGHVAIAKRYRAHAKEKGLLVTLEEKKKALPAVDRLVGAVNIWCWDRDALGIVKMLNEAGIERMLWSNRAKPEVIKAMNERGILTSRYDIYQDVMDPAQFPKLRGVHADWTTAAWPDDLMRNASGDWIKGWQVEAKDGTMIPCGVTCDKQAVTYARQRIPEELKTHPYLARFIDTTTASPWRECYDPRHSVTRSQSREWKMKLLEVVSKENGLVTGCETGHDASVPYLHFFEGMMSVANGRVADSGRRMHVIVEEVPPQVSKFQVGHAARLPLWELVYHDCIVSYWYWGDYNNKLPAVWRKRDLFNALYATPGMFMFDRAFLEKNKARFRESYATWATIARRCGYSEMTDHVFLTADRTVQSTTFANGVKVVVNFGKEAHELADGGRVGGESLVVR